MAPNVSLRLFTCPTVADANADALSTVTSAAPPLRSKQPHLVSPTRAIFHAGHYTFGATLHAPFWPSYSKAFPQPRWLNCQPRSLVSSQQRSERNHISEHAQTIRLPALCACAWRQIKMHHSPGTQAKRFAKPAHNDANKRKQHAREWCSCCNSGRKPSLSRLSQHRVTATAKR